MKPTENRLRADRSGELNRTPQVILGGLHHK
jgi:hypothetical protein